MNASPTTLTASARRSCIHRARTSAGLKEAVVVAADEFQGRRGELPEVRLYSGDLIAQGSMRIEVQQVSADDHETETLLHAAGPT
jgi:hypothetical protein